MPTGLVRHKNGTYYLRLRIPVDLQAWAKSRGMGTKEVSQSLFTSDRKTAIDRFHIENGKLQATWRQRRQQVADHMARHHVEAAKVIAELTPELIDAIAAHVEATALAGDEARRVQGYTSADKHVEGRPPAYTLEEIEDYQQAYADVLPSLKAAVAIGDVTVLGPMCAQFLYLHGYENRLAEQDFRRLAIAFGRAAIKTNEKLLRRYEGEDVPTPSEAVKSSPLLSALVSAYVEGYDKKKEQMLKKINFVMPLCLQVIGDRPVHTLKQADINGLFQVINRLPPRWNVLARQRDLSVREVVALGLPEIHKNTFDGTYLAAIAPFLDWCQTNYLDEGFPPHLTLKGIRYTGSRDEDENNQRAIRPNELERLFSGSEMHALAQNQDSLHQFWLPHVGLFTGARVNELCQLNPQTDIIQCPESLIWYFHITNETEGDKDIKKRVKNKKSRRAVPIHSRLIELGILQYAARMKELGKTLLFSPFIPYNGRASGEAQKWFRGFLEALGLRDDTLGAKLTGMHAFRSTFLSRAADLDVQNASVITGHSSASQPSAGGQAGDTSERKSAVVERYEGPRALAYKQAVIERIDWPQLKLYRPRQLP
ncbi:MAG TPA: DUF6538 domain-containing protein [Burkholderiaceae bacterium]|nr:DUF6538 domain-containing protein [Burkholderiaceae bacterium]